MNNVIQGPWRWAYCVPWVDVDGREHKTPVRGCQNETQAILAVAYHYQDELADYIGDPYPVAEPA